MIKIIASCSVSRKLKDSDNVDGPAVVMAHEHAVANIARLFISRIKPKFR